MRILLDSHIFLWSLNNPELIGPRSVDILNNNQLLVSVVTIWELGLKYKKHKQPYSIAEMLEGVEALNAGLLHLQGDHLQMFEIIELKHKDPFDSLLVAQSEAEKCLFMTVDRSILGAQNRYKLVDASQ